MDMYKNWPHSREYAVRRGAQWTVVHAIWGGGGPLKWTQSKYMVAWVMPWQVHECLLSAEDIGLRLLLFRTLRSQCFEQTQIECRYSVELSTQGNSSKLQDH